MQVTTTASNRTTPSWEDPNAQFAAPVLDGDAGLAVLPDGAKPTPIQEQAPPITPQPAQPASTTLADLARETDLLARQFDRKPAAQTMEPPIERAAPLGTVAARELVDTAPPAPPPAAAAYVGEPPVDPQWLAERETALVAIRADYEAARAQALTTPPGPGWIEATTTLTDESGQRRSINGGELVFVSDPNAPLVLAGYDDSSRPLYQPAGSWMEFNEDAFAAHFRSQGSAPLQALATLYGTDVPGLFAQHPQIWSLATAEHALNAGPAPAGRAMGDPDQLGMLDLYMADPQIAALINTYGGQPAPASGDIAREQVRIHGQQRYEQMSRLGNAMASVRNQYTDALGQAQSSGSGAGWIERACTITLSDESGRQTTQTLVVTDENGQPQRDSAGQPLVVMERVFDPDAFTNWYTQQGGLQHQAFKSFYGSSHTRYGTDESGQSIVTAVDFDNPKWSMAGVGGQMRHNDLQGIDPNDPPRLRNRSAVGFDLEAGWATAHDNIKHKSDWIDSVFQVAFTAVAAWFGAVTLGPAAASAMGMTTTTAAGTALTTAGTIVSGAVAGATTSVASGMISGNLTLKGILQGALSGGLTAGLMNTFGAAAASQAGAAGTVALRMTVQGGIQELLGGKFRDGALAALASGVADLAGANMLKGIDNALEAGTMNAAEAFAAKGLARMFGSALRALGSPGDPAYAFASAFVSDMVNAGLDAGAQGYSSETDADMASRQRVPPPDPFGMISDDAEIPYGDALADELGLRPGDLVDAGWTTELGRSAEVLRGFAEGTGFSLLSTGEAIIEVMRSPRQFINGVGLLLSSAEAREQLGEELVNRARIDVQMMEDAFAAGDLRGTAQQLGKLTADLAQVAGGVEAITRLGVSASTAGGRLVLGAMDDLAEAALHKIPSLFDAGGRPLMDFRALTTAQKQIIGETMGAEAVGRLVPDAQRIGRLPTVGQQGIDDLYKVKRPDVDYLLVEYKFGASRLGNTIDGVQMSDGWLLGSTTGVSRIAQSAGPAEALAIDRAIMSGRIERWVVHTDPLGNVTVGMVDRSGRFIPKPRSALIGG